MSSRALPVLERFPAHLALTDPGKRAGLVVDGLAGELDVLTRQVGDVRIAHRLGEAPSRADLLGLAGVHGLGSAALEVLHTRLAALSEAAATEPVDVAVVSDLTNIADERLAELDDLAGVAGASSRHRQRLARERDVVRGVIGALAVGNGTPAALLGAAAAYLGMHVDEIHHTEQRWWHIAICHDAIALVAPPPPAPGDPPPSSPPTAPPDLTPLPDVLALEENPFRTADIDPTPRRHGTRFGVLRGGLEDVTVAVRVVGIGNRTVRPMVVHLDTGRGVVFEGDVPDAGELVFGASGLVTLGEADVTGSAWAFAGGVFASEPEPLPFHDFVFTDADQAALERPEGPAATYSVSTPIADAFDPAPSFPHGAAGVTPLALPVGQSRWVGFVRLARAGIVEPVVDEDDAPASRAAIPRPSAGFFDGSVFADSTDPANPSPGDPSLSVGFSWEEREPFAVRLLLPRRLERLDDEAGTHVREPLRLLLDRHRAAGVSMRIAYADPRWTMGTGIVRETPDDPLGVVLSGTELWPDGTPQPSPD